MWANLIKGKRRVKSDSRFILRTAFQRSAPTLVTIIWIGMNVEKNNKIIANNNNNNNV